MQSDGTVKKVALLFFIFLFISFFALTRTEAKTSQKEKPMQNKTEIATLGGGCFWCIEAIYERVRGVIKVTSGYSGGHVENPTYEQVSTGTTGHAEAVQIEFDPTVISYNEILDIFWQIHDPTQLNRQGNDIGPQYRSVIFYHDERQKEIALKSKAELEKENIFDKPIVTEITAFKRFYPAESYHKNYYDRNSDEPYCQLVITPKLQKFKKHFSEYLKK